MASVGEWIAGARPRTLPTAVSPVLVGTGAAVGAGAVQPVRALLALVVAVALVVGVNYANDYSDGIRGTDDERVGPMRLVGSRLAAPTAVRNAAFLCFSVAALAGLTLVSLTRQWWLVAVGAVCIAGAWFYTGGRRPYGYAGLGEVAVFMFFGPVAVLGTAVTQSGTVSAPGDRRCRGRGPAGVRRAGGQQPARHPGRHGRGQADAGGRASATGTRGGSTPRACWCRSASSALAGIRSWPMLLGLLALPLAVAVTRRVLGGADGRRLVRVLGDTGLLLLAWSVTTGVGLALGPVA